MGGGIARLLDSVVGVVGRLVDAVRAMGAVWALSEDRGLAVGVRKEELAARDGVELFAEDNTDCLRYADGARRLAGTGVLGLDVSGLPMPRLTFPYLLMNPSAPAGAFVGPTGNELVL